MIPPLTSSGLTVERAVCAVTVMGTERWLLTAVSLGFQEEWNWADIEHVKILFQPYQPPKATTKHTWIYW